MDFNDCYTIWQDVEMALKFFVLPLIVADFRPAFYIFTMPPEDTLRIIAD